MIKYSGKIRSGGINDYIDNGEIHECPCCGTMRLSDARDHDDYVNGDYRASVGHGVHQEHMLMILRLLPVSILKGKTVLDVGAGDGYFLRYANNYAKKVIAIEPNKNDRESLEEFS